MSELCRHIITLSMKETFSDSENLSTAQGESLLFD